jgi:CHAT domain-containing protein/tetratricopeptide (TPR) repeat protein
MNQHSSPGRHQLLNLSNLPHCVTRSFVIVLAFVFLPFASISWPRVSAQTPDPRDAAANNAYQDGLALFQQGTAESLRAALGKLETARSIFREIKNQLGEANSLLWLGHINERLSEKQQALAYYNQALPLYRAVGDRNGEAATLNNIGAVYSSLGEKQKALEHYNQALTLYRAIGDRSKQAVTLNNIGTVYSSLGEKQKALEHFNQTLTLFRAVGDRSGEATMLNNLMIVWQGSNNSRLATFYGKQSINRYQELRRAIQGLDKETQKTYLQTVADTYRALADLLIEQGRLPEAQFVLSLLKDEEFFEFVRRDKDEIAALARSVELNEVEQKAFAEYASLADELTSVGAKYQTLFDKRSTLGDKPLPDAAEEAEFQKLSQQLATTSDTFQKFLARLAGEFAKAKSVANVQIARINELQADLREVGPDVVLVSTFVLPDRYRVILTTGQTQVDHKTEIKEGDLNRKLTCFLMALKNPRVDPRPLGKELYDILVKPLEKDLEKGKFKTILWSLDGALRYIPVAALWDGEHYLAERYQNAIITLGRNSRLFREVNRDWRALGAGVSAKWPNFDELPAVKTELRSIVRDERLATETEGVLPGRRLLDGEFLASRLKDLLPSLEGGRRFNLIHLASHFKLRQTRDTSFLLLGDGTELSLTEFDKDPRLKLTGVELLTLSACETGVGIDKGDGSEFESLGMLAEKNGAKAVMATLWQVADCSTGEFMREFYRLYQQAQQQGMTKAAALQQAQQAMLIGAIQSPAECQARTVGVGTKPDVCAMPPFTPNPAKPFAHPYYWAPFVLFGNWR